MLGFPLEHSFSQKYFTEKFKKLGLEGYSYQNFEIEHLKDFFENATLLSSISGLNVTIPYKEKVIPFLDVLDPIAKEVGAVNTIRCSVLNNKLHLKGYNTDVMGFEHSLKKDLPNLKKALILGTGGASKAIEYVCKKNNIEITFVSRTKTASNISYTELNSLDVSHYQLIVNTTPVGTYPNVNETPEFPFEKITSNHFVYDLIYNPEETLFLKKARQQGAKTMNGLPMLIEQAEQAWDIWNS